VSHDPKSLLGAVEDAREVGVDDKAPLFGGELVERNRRRAGAGVVEQQIEPPEPFDCASATARPIPLPPPVTIATLGGISQRS
jgi:hypothetical protein